MSIFGKARAGENLSPAARAFLRLCEGLAATAIVAALPVVSDALSRGTVDWADVGRAALAAASTAVGLAILKYAKAHGDTPLAPAQPTLSAPVTQMASVPTIITPTPVVSLPAPDANAPILVQDEPAPAQ